jgi:hypothetical protein
VSHLYQLYENKQKLQTEPMVPGTEQVWLPSPGDGLDRETFRSLLGVSLGVYCGNE